jgi:hypothetical protein
MAGNIAMRANGKWRARYRDEAGKKHSRQFDRKLDAQQWLDHVTSAVVTGTLLTSDLFLSRPDDNGSEADF